MIRFGMFVLLAFISAHALAQGPDETKKKADEADELVLKRYHDTYPPLYEHIQVTIEDAGPLEIARLYHKKGTNLASVIQFSVALKNIGDDKFDWVPDNIKIEVMDSKGVAIPVNHVRRRPVSVDGGSTNAIEKGHSSSARFALAIEDDKVVVGTKYTIVASYVQLWEKPAVKYACLSTTKTVEAITARPKE